ncbi:MAG: hypothetical protein K2K74_00620 [Lachnospiraceae bacterium]|nr:hypothetical protein [Lachnospiraceae bacterium]
MNKNNYFLQRAEMDMGNEIKVSRRFWVAFMLLCVILMGRTSLAAEDTSQSENPVFDIAAQLLSSDEMTYDIQLTIHNQGDDWEGTVRVQMDISYDSLSCAYDTAISLPQGSTKQFVVKIPVRSIEEQDATMKVSLLDRRKNVTAEKRFRRFLLDGTDALAMGILSDSYRSLTYLDLGGESIDYGGVELPISLVELDQDNLMDSLNRLVYLVIDNYNTSVLTDKSLEGIRQWVNDGGMLIVGTGEHAEDTLSGLDFLEIECTRVYEPGERISGEDYGAGLENLSMADLRDKSNRYYEDSDSLVMLSSWGYGAVEIVPYALYDLNPSQIVENWECNEWKLLQNVNDFVRISPTYGNQNYNRSNYIVRNIFKSFGNGGDRLNFGVLKFIVVMYVIFVGPVLYLILRAMKKRDWYWGAVPVTVLVGIFLVYIAGSGFEVVNTRVHSVTVEKLSGQDAGDRPGVGSVTYMHCYDAGRREWRLQLADRYEYVGPFLGNYYGNADDQYYYHILGEGDSVFFGLNPDSSFEDGYFLAGTSQNMETGSISSDLTTSAQWGITGTVTNGTSRDFKYFAVIAADDLFIYENLPAGETCTLEEADYTSWQKGYGSTINAVQYCMSAYAREKNGDYDTVAALGTGIFEIYIRENYSGGTVIIGITEDWYKAVEEDCSETAYGCLYAVQ